jgi:hypothetical protein
MEEIKVKYNDDSKDSTSSKSKKSKKRSGKAIIGVLILVILLLGAGLAFYYQKYQKVKKNPDIVTKEETQAIVEKVGKLIDLPKDETPTLATILDKEKLKDQAFFNNAKNGDKILIYTKAQKAIIYREADNKIINVGPVTLNQSNQVLISVVNAGGNTADAQKKVAEKYGAVVNVVQSGDAKNKAAIKKTVVVDTTGRFSKESQEIADMLGGSVGQTPAGESVPEGAAIVIFVK